MGLILHLSFSLHINVSHPDIKTRTRRPSCSTTIGYSKFNAPVFTSSSKFASTTFPLLTPAPRSIILQLSTFAPAPFHPSLYPLPPKSLSIPICILTHLPWKLLIGPLFGLKLILFFSSLITSICLS